MSDITKKFGQDHRTQYDGRWSCDCGHDYGHPLGLKGAIEAHRLGAFAAIAWDECLELLQNNSEISLDDEEHYKQINPYREQEEA